MHMYVNILLKQLVGRSFDTTLMEHSRMFIEPYSF